MSPASSPSKTICASSPDLTFSRLKEFFAAAPVLVLTAVVMVLDLVLCTIGLLTDHTVITGVPAWIKPTKFATSVGIYALSLVIIIRYTPIWRKTLHIVEFLIGISLTAEIVLIDIQAARHTTSHFNVATAFDQTIWNMMASFIGTFWICSIVVAVATFRARYGSRLWTIAIRSGMLLTVIGSGIGLFMTPPSQAQLELARRGHATTIGSHTIGGVDGGPGLPVLGWSTQFGDVRVAHFLGLHSLQVLALIAFLLQRWRAPERKAERVLSVAVFSYAGVFLVALVEALSKRPITAHDPVATLVWLIWAAISLALLAYAARDKHSGAIA